MDAQKLSFVLNGVLVLAIIILVAFGIKEGNFDGVDKKSLEKEYVPSDIYNARDDDAKRLQQEVFQRDSKINSLNREIRELNAQLEGVDETATGSKQKKQISFKDLPSQEQQNYVLKSDHEKIKNKIVKLEAKVKRLKDEKSKALAKLQKGVESTTDTRAQKTVQKPQKQQVKSAAKAEGKKPLFSMTCSDHLSGSFDMSSDCKERVLEVIANYGDNYSYNVIGVVDPEPFGVIKALHEADEDIAQKLGVSEFQLKQFEAIAPLGLARARAKEAMQLLRRHLDKDTTVTQASYELILENRRGLVLQVLPK